jgi:exodeoxyribonuclease V alpha subunit
VDGIRAYLASSLVKGVGPATAQRITDAFGEDSLRIIEEEPDRLKEVKGLGAKRVVELVAAVRAQKEVQAVMIFLRTHGLGPALAGRIVKQYGAQASALIEANPYRLAEEVIGVGFRTADRLAGQLGLAPDAPERIRAGILHSLAQAAREGHCYLPASTVAQATAELLGCDQATVLGELPALADEGRIHPQPLVTGPGKEDEDQAIYPTALHLAEAGSAAALNRLLKASVPALTLKPDRAVAWYEKHSGLPLPEGQRQALVRALQEAVSVITGGPGVGKTSIIRALAQILQAKHLELLLAAPTGRAAKRLEESTNKAASTLHRLLEFQPGVNRFQRDATNPLRGHMLVVDEASMLDIQLAYNLLRAIPAGMRLVLVGDVDQLPAVGPGRVLGDIIDSGRVPVTALTEIFRQKDDSAIVRSAHAVLRGEVPESGEEGSDFFLVETKDSAQARAVIRELVSSRIPAAFHLDPMADIQVLCPMYRGETGADNLNRDLQDLLNPGGVELERNGRMFREGDKVLQVRNDYDSDVFNGDTGRIVHIDPANGRIQVRFGDRELSYRTEDLDQLLPAYAISVHRSQGSEYPAVVIPLTTEHFLMLRRSLLYTAMTRGRQLVVLVGSRKALAMAVQRHEEAARFSGLAERLAGPSQSNVQTDQCETS